MSCSLNESNVNQLRHLLQACFEAHPEDLMDLLSSWSTIFCTRATKSGVLTVLEQGTGFPRMMSMSTGVFRDL